MWLDTPFVDRDTRVIVQKLQQGVHPLYHSTIYASRTPHVMELHVKSHHMSWNIMSMHAPCHDHAARHTHFTITRTVLSIHHHINNELFDF